MILETNTVGIDAKGLFALSHFPCRCIWENGQADTRILSLPFSVENRESFETVSPVSGLMQSEIYFRRLTRNKQNIQIQNSG